MELYPMKLRPAVKEIIWGGDKLKKEYHKTAPFENIAESWELTVRPDGMNVIDNGVYKDMPLGDYLEKGGYGLIGKNYDADRFPLLIKFIDARDKLSIQVHPSDDYALKNEGEFGKTEMWYIVEADEGAELVFGLKEDCMREEFERAVAEHRIGGTLRYVKVHAGEVYFIPSGLVHAIGAGILICEIQQNSNITYRVYDYDRPGKDGKPRELHVEKAKKVIVNYTPEEIEKLRFSKADRRDPDLLAACDKFTVRKYDISGDKHISVGEDSFASLTFTDGEGIIRAGGKDYPFVKGDTYYLSAGLGEVSLVSEKAVCIRAGL